MRVNRSMPRSAVIPVLAYPDVRAAIDWLREAFGFALRLRIGDHRAQLVVGDGAVVVTGGGETAEARADAAGPLHSVMVRVEDVDRHHQRAAAHGARILQPPTTFPYGERQYSALDPAGHVWTFSQSVDDVAPSDWGGELVEPDPDADIGRS